MSNMCGPEQPRFVTLAVPDRRVWVRIVAFLRRRPVPTVIRDYMVTRNARGEEQLTEIWFGDHR